MLELCLPLCKLLQQTLVLRHDIHMTKHENVHRGLPRMLFNNFIGGIAWSVGVWIGTTVIIAFAVFVISKINLIPLVGNFVAEVTKYVERTNSPFEL